MAAESTEEPSGSGLSDTEHQRAVWLLDDIREALFDRLTNDELGLFEVLRQFHKKRAFWDGESRDAKD